MGKFTTIPKDTFQALQTNAGILLKKFDPDTGNYENADIVCATTGGINATCVPTYSDYGEDVDNCPVNTKELKQLDGWECKMAFTSLGMSPDAVRLSLGAADMDKATGKITPRRNVKLTDFADLWWVGDKGNGGMLAIRMMNALSTGGFSLQTTKNGKGQNSMEITGHVSIEEQDVVPMEFYSTAPSEAEEEPSTPQTVGMDEEVA